MMKTRNVSRSVVGLGVAAILLSSALPASAIPAWARRYNLECTTCHYYPSLVLTSIGLDFHRRGHRFIGDTFTKDFTHILSGHGEWQYQTQTAGSTAFGSPDFHFHAGGAFSAIFSGYLDANVNQDFETIYIQATKSFGEDAFVTARAGKISPSIIRTYANGLMGSSSTPLIITEVGLEDNPFTPARDSFGLDIAARYRQLFVQAGVVNGDEQPGATVSNRKDAYLSTEYNVHDGVSGVGLYYFHGGYGLGDPSAGLRFDSYYRTGVFANLTRDKYRINGAYLFGTDSIVATGDRKLRGYYVQAEFHPAGFAVPFVRFDEVKTEDEIGTATVRAGAAGCNFRLYQTALTGGSLSIEASRRSEAGQDTDGALIDLMWVF